MHLKDIPKLVINLPHRTDRLEAFKKEVAWLNDFAQVVPGVSDNEVIRGIAQAHMNCLRTAKENNWDHVLIMEDDVVFHAKGKTAPYLNDALNQIPEDWDILLGGLYEAKSVTRINEYWSRVTEFCGIHFYIVRISSRLEPILLHDGKTHFDRFLNKGGKKLNCYVTNKFIATQRSGYSDQRKKYVDDSDRIKRFALL